MSVHPFDPKSVLLARHAQHVVLVHFPIALFITGVFCDVLAHWRGRRALKIVAQFNLWAAAIMVVPVVATGLAAWQWQLEGQRLKGVLRMHLLFGCAAAALLWLVILLRRRNWSSADSSLPPLHAAFELLAVAAIAVTAHLGGFVSGVNLPG
ncbi:MAG: DUF2231 domain-containing protein [Terriglobales bacterium]